MGEGMDRSATLGRFDTLISAWLSLGPQNTLNLAHQKDARGNTQLIFIPRVDVTGKHHPPEISNGFAGCEVCGRIHIESRQEWEQAAASTPDDIDRMLRAIAPPAESIERLESLC